MNRKGKEIWITIGYQIFAEQGQQGLKIEPLAQVVGKSKSSFYHYFADMEVFIENLLRHHMTQITVLAEKERNAQNINPELIAILVAHKTDLLFNRQLRIYKNVPAYGGILQQTDSLFGDAFISVWMKDLGIKLPKSKVKALYTLALENFFLQINPENITTDWLTTYFEELNKVVTML